ncbi:MAG: hypothetical protein RLZZ61_1535, partial [Pseudomonadota bacterium]
KAAPRIRLMEQTSLNQPTPSAGSSTSASASAVPLFSMRARAHSFCRKYNCACRKYLDLHPRSIAQNKFRMTWNELIKRARGYPPALLVTTKCHLSRGAVARFANGFNVFAHALDGVAGCSQQRCGHQDDRCNFAHDILQELGPHIRPRRLTRRSHTSSVV